MRIAHFFHALDPAEGGTFRVMMNMAISTAEMGHNVEVWALSIPDPEAEDVRRLKEAVRVVHHPGPAGRLSKAGVERFSGDFERIDLLHLHTLWRPLSWHASRLAKHAGVRTILTMHGMLMEHPMSISRLKKRLYLPLIGKRTLGNVDVVQMLNSEESRQSRLVGVDFPYVELPNGVDASQFAALPEPGAYRSTEPGLADKTIILSMGRLHDIKGCDLLLGAFLDVAETRDDLALVMAGPDEGSLPEIMSMLEGHPARDRVRLPGLVHGDQRLAMLADADIFAQCSRHETASMSVLEAAYAGKPLLLTDKCNYPEFVAAGTGVETPTTREGVREGLESLLERQGEFGTMGERARAVVNERFLHGTIMEGLVGIYEKLLAGERYPMIQSG